MDFDSDAAKIRVGQEDYTATTYPDGGIFPRGWTDDQVCNVVSIDHERVSVTAPSNGLQNASLEAERTRA